MKPTERILFLDVETLPLLGYAWTAYDADILKVVKPTIICCWSAKWMNGKSTTRALCDYKGYKAGSRDDKKLCEELWELLDEADVVVAHNGKKFDIKKVNYRFITNGLPPPSPYYVIDTLLEYKNVAEADRHKLGDLLPQLGLGEKLDSGGLPLWFGCEAGDEDKWTKMKRYNANDTAKLEPFYLRLRPWIKNHPNLANGYGPGICPRCGSTRIVKRGFRHFKTTSYQRYKCLSCSSWIRDGENLIKKEDKPYVAI